MSIVSGLAKLLNAISTGRPAIFKPARPWEHKVTSWEMRLERLRIQSPLVTRLAMLAALLLFLGFMDILCRLVGIGSVFFR